MSLLYIPKCKPFYKFSVLTLQLQIGLKCNLAQTQDFGLPNIKTSLRDTLGVPQGWYDLLGATIEHNLTQQETRLPLPLNVCITVRLYFGDALLTSNQSSTVTPALDFQHNCAGAMASIESMIGMPARPPHGYVLWQKQRLRERTDAVGKPLPPHFVEMNNWKYVRIEDLAASDRSPSSGLSLPQEPKNEEISEIPEGLVEQAMVKEYVYTGEREKDVQALHGHIEACDRAIRALDPGNRAARTLARFQLRMNMTILKESLKEELEVLSEEVDGNGYQGFDDGPVDAAELSCTRSRPKGYRWTCPGWLRQ